MLKAPRYMREYAAAIKKSKAEMFALYKNPDFETARMRAGLIVKHYESGLITENEAMREPAKL